ncbi:MAG: hypothetical protein R3281_08590 [Balneolaceae bacterium]|nr:hypothetical protein [Balneolaceae bacterium]
MKKTLLIFLLFGALPQVVYSQFYPTTYRPPDLNWQELQTPRFRIVFPEGEDSAAYRMGRILEYDYPRVQKLVGGSLTEFPIVLNNYNDRSNGFVTTLHFRSEIEIPPIKGKTMNPKTGNWLETVGPHELVHALHHSNIEGIWARAVNIFAPDIARSIHGSIPLGVHEGIATYHESAHIAPGGGRGNYPFFTNQFDAVFNSSDRWGMGTMLGFSRYSRPFDRHYIGGYEFTGWLHETHGDRTTKDAIDFFIRWPFLGYGTALKHATGYWPGQLYRQFEERKRASADRQGSDSYEPLAITLGGRAFRRPIWISNNRLLMHGSAYNASPGFYTYSLDQNELRKLAETQTVSDYRYSLNPERSRLVFSNYRPSRYYDNTFKMDLFELNIADGSVSRLTTQLRAYAPVHRPGGYWALQTDHDASSLIRLSPHDADQQLQVEDQFSLPNTEFVAVVPNPRNPAELAIIANRRGLQGLWIVDEQEIGSGMQEQPEISFMNGSVFDPAWHPDARQLLFSSDITGAMQLYEYHLAAAELTRLTDAAYNAMEGSYSPDGERIAFVVQQKNERLPVVKKRDELSEEPVPDSLWNTSEEKSNYMSRSELGSGLKEESDRWTVSPYRAGADWLSPRIISPIYSEVSNSGTYEFGIRLNSNDLLRQNSYQLDLTWMQRLPWYDFTYRYSGFFPGFEVGTFSEPAFVSTRVETESGSRQTLTFLRQELGLSLEIPARIVLENNVRFSSVGLIPSLELTGTRFFEPDHDGRAASDYGEGFSGNLFAFFNYRLQQNIRDLQPNSGLFAYSELEHAFSRGSTTVATDKYRFSVDFNRPKAYRAGLFLFAAPFKRWNQSLRLGLEGLTQTAPTFDNQNLVSEAFSERVFPASQHMMSLSSRYTVPLLFPDRGGFLFPAYLSSIYLVGFSDTVTDLDQGGLDKFRASTRTVLGLGLRTQFRISNLSFDIGIAVGYEPSRNAFNTFVGNF